MTQHQSQETLFDDPHQLLLIRDQLTALLATDHTSIPQLYALAEEGLATLSEQMGNLSGNTAVELHNAVFQLKETANEQHSNVCALSHLTIKMIDYIREQQQHIKSEREHYEHVIDQLRAQIDFVTNKNVTIEGDVEMFKEQLIAAQTELQEIAVVHSGIEGNDVSVCSHQQDERERRIWELQGQLQKIKEHLNIVKFQSIVKQSAFSLTPKQLSYNRSQSYIVPVEPNLCSQSNAEFYEQQVYMLRQKVRQLSSQNEQLRRELQQNATNLINSIYNKNSKIRESLQYEIEEIAPQSMRANRTEKMLPKITSFSNFTPVQENFYLQSKESKRLIPDQSTEKFHTLNSEVSSKSFEVNLNQYNVDSHLANLIFLGDEDEKAEGWEVQQTGETQNSMPHINSEVITKAFDTVAVNTEDSMLQDQSIKILYPSDECVCKSISRSWREVTSSFFDLRDMAVSKRISHKRKRSNLLDDRN